jgi:hypothetical protein
MALKLRRGTEAERVTAFVDIGEIVYVTDTKKVFVGDGATTGGILVGPVDTALFDVVSDTTPQLGGNLDLNGNNITGTGNISITGNITATGTINLGDGVEDNINVGGLINSSLNPAIDDSYNLGTSANQWRNVWATQVNVDTTLAVGSQIIKLSSGSADSNLVLWDAETDTLSASVVVANTVEGNLVGSVFGDNSTTLVDGVANLITGNVSNTVVTTNDIIINGPLGGITILSEGTIDDDYSLFAISTFHDSSANSALIYLHGRGTIAVPAPVQSGDGILDQIFLGTSANDIPAPAAQISVLVDPNGTVGNEIVPGQIEFTTFNDLGLPVVGLSLNRDGEISVADNVLSAGTDPGDVITSSVVSYLKITVGNTEYALPLYGIVPTP